MQLNFIPAFKNKPFVVQLFSQNGAIVLQEIIDQSQLKIELPGHLKGKFVLKVLSGQQKSLRMINLE